MPPQVSRDPGRALDLRTEADLRDAAARGPAPHGAASDGEVAGEVDFFAQQEFRIYLTRKLRLVSLVKLMLFFL